MANIQENLAVNSKNLSEEEIDHFATVYEELKAFLMESFRRHNIDTSIGSELMGYYSKCLDHTCTGGKKTRGLTVVLSAKFAAKETAFDKEMLHISCVVGWCVEFLQAFFLVADDIMDSSYTRRGKPCWYRLPQVNTANAINDSIFLNNCIFRILHHYTSGKPYYATLSDLFHNVSFNTIIGQHLDTNALKASPSDTVDLDRATRERYHTVVTYKTAYYSFFLPCALGMHIAGLTEEALFSDVQAITLQMGEYFQIQDDFLDAFASAELLGKIGTDIEEQKCSWLLLKALEIVSPEEKATLKQYYGSHDAQKIQWVKDLYKSQHLDEVFEAYEKSQKESLLKKIERVHHNGLKKLLQTLLAKIYKRPF